ncbi:CaiB/BaiF CoA transferase family protein [Pseudemcibacter aquimaris]|uniref:CaiB/BaiF CoA transferase family protein n=1 Tax=Pseudemcibacter aquimaris TaxID=2857064 RepID=UPI002010C97B|nr:CaiB/BaiF CoA-transferase family protein [Pseudemcibacter aquimaris]MCC3860553.1 CoA transferase [Pseudemcibacter aquimaris]WDU59376.1 CoA transferase [Pseudemcibacter aquimaris]
MAGPLSHIKVLDLSRVLAGPWSTQMLGDMGADVIKIERPGVGDDTRTWGPPFMKNEDGSDGDAAYFHCTNRNKSSRAIDITTPAGQDEIKALAEECDILVENYKVGGLKKYGLDYDNLSKVNPGLIYCSITGFGQTGPYANRAGYDFMIQAMGGMMSITGDSDENGGGPQKVGVAIADVMTGMYATIGILGALAHRDKTGEGQYIDLALLDTQIAMLANHTSNYLMSGNVPKRHGNEHVSIVPYQTFKTSDGDMVLAVGNDSQFEKFSALVGENWADDANYKTNAERVKNRKSLIPLIADKIIQKSTKEWVSLFEQHGVPCGPVNNIAEILSDPHVKERGVLETIKDENGNDVPIIANPIKYSKTPMEYKKAPPKRPD